MKRKVLSIVLTLFLLTSCAPKVPFDTIEKGMLGLTTVGQVLDYTSTQDALDRGCIEGNPIIGEDPSSGTLVLTKVISVGIAYTGAYWIDDHTWRKVLLGFTSLLGFGAAANNYSIDCN